MFLWMVPCVVMGNVDVLPARARGGLAYERRSKMVEAVDLKASYWRHALDNFGDVAGETFVSKYYVDASSGTPGGPRFLYIGGEGPQSAAAPGFVSSLASRAASQGRGATRGAAYVPSVA